MAEQMSFIPGYKYEQPAPEQLNGRRYARPVEMYGMGPRGKCCGTCVNLLFRQFKYRKCKLWIVSHSEATDIRLKNPACGKYEELK